MASVEEIRGGWGSFTFLVNGDHILRFARTPTVAAAHRREAALLPRLAGAVSFRVPEPDFFGSWGCDRTCIGYPLIPGRPLTATDGWRSLADLLRELHTFPADSAREALGQPGTVTDWRCRYQALLDQVVRSAPRVLDAGLMAALTGEFTAFLKQDWDFTPVLVHRDLAPEHVLVDDTGRIVGLIDFEDAAVGDPAIDFAGLLPLLGCDRVDELLVAYGRPVDRDRVRTYWRLAPVHDLLHGIDTCSRTITATAVADLRARLA